MSILINWVIATEDTINLHLLSKLKIEVIRIPLKNKLSPAFLMNLLYDAWAFPLYGSDVGLAYQSLDILVNISPLLDELIEFIYTFSQWGKMLF